MIGVRDTPPWVGSPRRRLDEHLNRLTGEINAEQAEAQQAAELVGAAVPVPPAPR
jgi:hypothetical protein